VRSFLFKVKRLKTNSEQKSVIIKFFQSGDQLSILQNFFTIQDIVILLQVCKDFHLISDKRSIWLSFCIDFLNYRAANYDIKNLRTYPFPKILLKNTRFLIEINRQIQNEKFTLKEIDENLRPRINLTDEIGDHHRFFKTGTIMMPSPILLLTIFYDSGPDKPAFHKKIRGQFKKYRSRKKIEELESKAIYYEKNSLQAFIIK
jgi:hypothetical protein